MKKWKKLTMGLLAISAISGVIPTIVTSCASTPSENNNGSHQPIEPNQPNKPQQPNNFLQGGNYNNLQVSKCFKLIKQADILNQELNLASLTNDVLNQAIHKQAEYQTLQLAIANGSSQTQGLLRLNLAGTYQNNPVNEMIEITGYNHLSSQTTYQFSKFSLNLTNWFDNNMPIDSSLDLDMNKSKKILLSMLNNSCELLINNQQYSLDQAKTIFNLKSISFSLNKQTKNVKYDIAFETNYKKYENNQWVNEQNQFNINLASNSNNHFQLPTFKQLKQFMMDSLSFNDQEFSNYYANYFLGRYRSVKLHLKPSNDLLFISNHFNLDAIEQKYQQYVANKPLYLTPNWQQDGVMIEGNDLVLNMLLMDDNNPNDFTISRRFTTSKCKNEIDYINALKQKAAEKKQFISIIPDNNTPIFNYFNKVLIHKVKQAFNNVDKKHSEQVVNLPQKYQLLKLFSWSDNPANGGEVDNDKQNQQFKDQYSKNISEIDILGTSFLVENFILLDNSDNHNTPTVDIASGLIYFNNMFNTLLADNITVSANQNIDINLIVHNTNPNLINISFEATLNIILYNQEEIRVPITYSVNYLKSYFNLN